MNVSRPWSLKGTLVFTILFSLQSALHPALSDEGSTCRCFNSSEDPSKKKVKMGKKL